MEASPAARRAARAARSAVFAPLAAVAATTGVSVEGMRATLVSLPSRGPCADRAAAAAAVDHRACPPPLLRSAPEGARPGRGAASWCARSLPGTAGLPPFRARAAASQASVPNTRMEVAMSVSCPPAAALRLAGNGRAPWVRSALLRSPMLSSAVVGVLSQDPDSGVRLQVAAHPGCPGSVLAALAPRRQPDDEMRRGRPSRLRAAASRGPCAFPRPRDTPGRSGPQAVPSRHAALAGRGPRPQGALGGGEERPHHTRHAQGARPRPGPGYPGSWSRPIYAARWRRSGPSHATLGSARRSRPERRWKMVVYVLKASSLVERFWLRRQRGRLERERRAHLTAHKLM